jgi:hypothetical protein
MMVFRCGLSLSLPALYVGSSAGRARSAKGVQIARKEAVLSQYRTETGASQGQLFQIAELSKGSATLLRPR